MHAIKLTSSKLSSKRLAAAGQTHDVSGLRQAAGAGDGYWFLFGPHGQAYMQIVCVFTFQCVYLTWESSLAASMHICQAGKKSIYTNMS